MGASIAGLLILIVQYPGGTLGAARLTYSTADSPSSGEWTKSLTGDVFEPGLFNPGETMLISGDLPATGADTGTVTVGTPNGVIDTACFDMLVACP